MTFLVAATALATWACDGAPEPKIHKGRPDTGPEDTEAVSVDVDATQPPFDAHIQSDSGADAAED